MAVAAILECLISKISLANTGRMAQKHHYTKFRQNWSFHCDVAIFRIFKMATAAILDFWNHKFLAIRVSRVETHQRAKFCQNRSTGRKNIKIFRFLNMAAAAILDCRIHKILLAVGVWRAHMHHCTKFRQNRSLYCGDIAIFLIFKTATAAILVFWNRVILLVIGVPRVETHHCAKFRQNQSIGCKFIKIFRFFKMAAAAILDFLRSRNVIGYWGLEGRDASACQILPKLVNRLRRY